MKKAFLLLILIAACVAVFSAPVNAVASEQSPIILADSPGRISWEMEQ